MKRNLKYHNSKKSWQPIPNPFFTFPQKKKMSELLVCFLIFSLALETLLVALHKSRLEAFRAFLTAPNKMTNITEQDLTNPKG